jgi:cell wall-associated NlpC family hydrolase
LKIKKVDDKPIIIHTKEKAKIHSQEPKTASIKGSNIYTIDRKPKKKKAAVSEKPAKVRNIFDYIKGKDKQAYRKSTKHGTDSTRENGISRFRRTVSESSQSVKLKETNLHVAGRIGAAGVKAATDQMEGGQEVQQAAYFAYEATTPVTGTVSKGAALFRKKSAEAKKRKIKKVEAGKKLGKNTAKKPAIKTAKNTAEKPATETAKNTAKETAKETAKTVAKKTAKTAVTAAASTAGTAAAPGAGTAIGIAAGYASGVAIEAKDTQISNRNRKIKFFLDKMKADENQQDSIVKLTKDLVTRRAVLWVKTVAPIAGMVLLLLVLLVAMVAVPVVAVLGVLYNSPFALFLPALESGDTVQTVTSAYVSEFNRDINTLANDHTGYDAGEIVYVDYEGADANPSNYYDIMAVYMVKYGVGNTATIMNDTSKSWLKTVVDDMCSYTTSTGSKTDIVTDVDGTISTITTTYLYVNVTLKSYQDMISVYGFGADEVELLEQIMSADFMGQLGGSPGVCSMTESEISAVLSGISDSTQRAVCDYALHRVGYPYSQDYRDSGNYYDCSSLAYYSWQSAGKSIAYGGATTAAAEAEGLESAGQTVSYDEIQPGDLIFYSFTNNGRYKNISHVAVYVGNGKVVEALNVSSGVVYRDVSRVGSIVLIGRP